MSSKLSITGRPGLVQKHGPFVAFTLKTPPVPQNLPKGLPTIKGEAKYLILVATKQWDKIEHHIYEVDREDRVYVEGYCTVQEGFPGIVVQATMINSIGLMRKRKEDQKKQAPKG